VTRSRAIERLAHADRILFDKTGTLTRGVPRLDEVRLFGADADRATCLAIAAALERHSEHPIARAFAEHTTTGEAHEVSIAPGRGLSGRVGDRRYRIGRADFVLARADPRLARVPASDDARPTVYLADETSLLASFSFIDNLREDARATIERLRALGLEPGIVSGDRGAVVAAIAARLGGLPATADASAGDKLALVHALQAGGHVTAMVGDGVNDAPVLAGADVSVAVGSGTDLAKVSADIVMPGDLLAPLAAGVEVSRRTLRVIRENLAWAAIYNATAVPLAAVGLLTPWMAALGMSISSLLVVLNATRLLREERRPIAAATPARLVRA
jgi:Cu2+-exporting ATPase